jgi:hypothetical protein
MLSRPNGTLNELIIIIVLSQINQLLSSFLCCQFSYLLLGNISNFTNYRWNGCHRMKEYIDKEEKKKTHGRRKIDYFLFQRANNVPAGSKFFFFTKCFLIDKH